MRTELFAVGLLAGCASTSYRPEVTQVQSLVSLPLPEATDVVDPELSVDIAALLRDPLSADTAVRVALLNNRSLRATLRGLGVYRGELVQAGVLPNPVLEFDLRRSTDDALPLQSDFYVEWDLTHAILTVPRSNAAEAALTAARFDAAAEVVDLGYRARAAFFALQATEQRFATLQRMLDSLAAARDAAEALFKAGNITALELASQEVAYQDARAQAAEEELLVQERREDLQELLGLYGAATEWKSASGLTALPAHAEIPGELEKKALDASLTLQNTKHRLSAIAERTGLARTQGWLPEIAIDAHAEQDGDAWEFGGGAAFTLPVFDRQQGTLGAYQAEFDALYERYLGDAVNLRSQARRARSRVLSAHARAKQFQDVIVPARTRVLHETLLQYNAMQVGVFQLLEAQRAQLSAELSHISALETFWVTQAALDALLAGKSVEVPRMSGDVRMGPTTPAAGH